jgi:N-acetylglucosamine kinase-like BadF-type ATPase
LNLPFAIWFSSFQSMNSQNKMKGKAKTVKIVFPRVTQSRREFVLGVDGGGTKTRAVIADDKQNILGEGVAGPSNPLRVGVQDAVNHICEAIDIACDEAGIHRSDILSAQVGLAGVRRQDIREQMQRMLIKSLGVKILEVVTDAEIALYGATNGSPGVVVIAGTGSICCGINARGKRACSGGWGPIAGDEGSGFNIARRALQSVAQASDGRAPKTILSNAACDYFRANTIEDIAMAIYAPKMTHKRLSDFARYVIEAAVKGDKIACEITADAGRDLGSLAVAVIKQLNMQRDRFQIAYVGSIFKAGDILTKPMLETIHAIAPKAYLAPPQLDPATAATRMAQLLLKPRLAIAV